MQILTAGGMEDFSKCPSISRTFSLICCVLWIFSPAEGKTISDVSGSRVKLHCRNESISALSQLTWKMNGVSLFSFIPQGLLYVNPKAHSLNINMSDSESQLYALVIERAQKSHTGNYTCETTTEASGAQEEKWELIITEREEAGHWDTLTIAVAAAVPCVCVLIFIIALAIMQRVGKRRAENSMYSPTAQMQQEQTDDIYENCLETRGNQRRVNNQHHHHKPRAH